MTQVSKIAFLNTLIKSERLEEFKRICRFIASAEDIELYCIVEEIRCIHDNLYSFNEDTKLFAKIESTCLNGDAIQLNIENNK